MPTFTCEGEFGTETIEADDVNDAAIKCAEAHAGLDGEDICTDPWTFTVNGGLFSAEVTEDVSRRSRVYTLRVYNADDVEINEEQT